MTDKYERIKLGNQLCFPLYVCAKEIVRLYRKPLENIGLTYTQYIVMMVLWEKETLTEGELGEALYLDSGTLTPLLKKLENEGLIKKERLKSNERKVQIILSEKGREMKEEAVKVPDVMDGCVGLCPEEGAQLKKILEKIIDHMREHV